MSLPLATKFRGRHAPGCARVPEAKPVCTLFSRCKGCPYPNHGFICWSRDGPCMREIMKKLSEGVEKNDV